MSFIKADTTIKYYTIILYACKAVVEIPDTLMLVSDHL